MLAYERFLSAVGIGSFLDILRLEELVQAPDYDVDGTGAKKINIPDRLAGEFLEEDIPSIADQTVMKKLYLHSHQAKLLDRFYELAQNANIFAFEEQLTPDPGLPDKRGNFTVPKDIDLPFETCVFEVLPKAGRGDTAILIHEKAPRIYEIFWIKKNPKLEKLNAFYYSGSVSSKTPPLSLRVAHLLQRLTVEEAGIEKVNIREKIGIGSARRRVGIVKIIRVAPKSFKADAIPLGNHQIDWSHRWLVRGHWRRSSGVGKNRLGEYVVHGHTWVISHEKGPEEAELVAKKTRFVMARTSTDDETHKADD